MKSIWRDLGPPKNMGGRIRWLFLLNMAFFLITTLARVANKPGLAWTVRLSTCVALALVTGLWYVSYRRQRYPAWLVPVHLALFTVIGYGLHNWVASVGLLYAAVMYLGLWGSWRLVTANTVVVTTGLGIAVAATESDMIGVYLQQSAGIPMLAFFSAAVAIATDRQERSSAREKILSEAGSRQATRTDTVDVCQVSADAGVGMLAGVPGRWAVVSLIEPYGERVVAQAGTPPEEMTGDLSLDEMPADVADAYQRKQGVYLGRNGYSTRSGTRLLVALSTDRHTYGNLLVGADATLQGDLRQTCEALAAQTVLGLVNAEYAADLHRMAFHDGLTGLANRVLLRDRIGQAIERAKRGSHVAVMLLDLDGFKQVNDVYGHAAGDFLLSEVARRLHAGVRGADTAARLGGDEFTVLLDGMDSPGDANLVAGRLLDDVQAPIRFGSLDLTPRVSIGVASWRDQDVDAILHDADRAMYAAKVAGKGRVAFIDPDGGTVVVAPTLDPALSG